MIDRDVEEALDLTSMQVDGHHAVDARRRQQVGHQSGADRRTRLALAVLPGVAEIWNHGNDRAGGGALERIDHDQQFHQVVIDRRAGGLHDEAIHTPDVLLDLDVDLAIGEAGHVGIAERRLDIAADRLRELAVGIPAEYRQSLEHDRPISPRGTKNKQQEQAARTRQEQEEPDASTVGTPTPPAKEGASCHCGPRASIGSLVARRRWASRPGPVLTPTAHEVLAKSPPGPARRIS